MQRTPHPSQNAQQGTFPHAIPPQQGDQFALGHLQREMFGQQALPALPLYISECNILKLQFDDVIDVAEPRLVPFTPEMARRIVEFVAAVDRSRELFINCAAGISRSGAVGEVLDEYFNRYLEQNELDHLHFTRFSSQIQGNSLVRRLLRRALKLTCDGSSAPGAE